MNTKRLFFGLLAVGFLAMSAVSTSAITVDDDQTVSIEKKKIRKL